MHVTLKVKAALDPQFMPMAVVWRAFEREVSRRPSQRLGIAVERNRGLLESITLDILRDGGENDARNASSVIAMSASLPASSEPFCAATPMARAGFRLAMRTASCSGRSVLRHMLRTASLSLSTLPAMVPSAKRHSIPFT